MKKFLSSIISIVLFCPAFAQQMRVKSPNYSSFYKDKQKVSENLLRLSSTTAKNHPEFGVLPYNAQCSECVELIDKRTDKTRLFIDPKNEGHTYSQSSYFPLHYQKSENDIWRTIDKRLKPDANNTGVYVASNQPVPTKCDLNRKSTTLVVDELEFEFNKNLTLYFFDENNAYTQRETSNYSNYTIGQEGLLVTNMWQGINMLQTFGTGRVKTNYVINAPLQLPINTGWMVIEDHFTLPNGYTFEQEIGKQIAPELYYQGDYLLKNSNGVVLAKYEKPVYVDAIAWGQHGSYKLLRNGNDYTLQMYVPIDWLKRADNVYPIVIDPIVSGFTHQGEFRLKGLSAYMAFTSKSIGACNYPMNVKIPGRSVLTNAYIDLEYQLTFDNTCGSPPLPSPFCTFSQVTQEIKCDACNTTTGKLTCSPAQPPFTGTCTTDSNMVPGAHAIHANSLNSNFISCIPFQCANYSLNFTLSNQDSICDDSCGFVCARGNMWQMTVEAQATEINITMDTGSIACAGQPAIFIAHTKNGIPPLGFIWKYDSISDTIIGDSTYTIPSLESSSIICHIYDSCGAGYWDWQIDTLEINLPPTPFIIQNGDTLISSQPFNNLWYLNDTLIPGATERNYIVTQDGKYTLRTIDNSGCASIISTALYLGIEGINNSNNKASVTLYPNPATNKLIITATNFTPQSILIYDVNGKKISERKFATQIDIESLHSGIYFIELKSQNVTVRKKFSKL